MEIQSVFVDGLELVFDKTIIVDQNSSLDVEFGSDQNHLKIRFKFESPEGSENKEPSMSFDLKAKENPTIFLKNWNNTLGSSTNSPMKIGIFKSRDLYVSFSAHSINQIKIFTLNFLLGEENDI